MQQSDHISDVQLNEYLDGESMEHASIEAHLSSCGECAARLTALRALFAEIESLPELELSRDLAARFTSTQIPLPQLPRWLTLTAVLQAGLAVIAIILAAPFAAQLLEPYSQLVAIPTLSEVSLDLRSNFTAWMGSFGPVSLPEIPRDIFSLPAGITPGILAVSVMGMMLAWALGNWWLLHRKTNSLA